jgi:hypothetical protein
MDIILYGFTYTDFKVMNIEACENIGSIAFFLLYLNKFYLYLAEVLKEYIFLALCDDEMC